ncbi:hypothetical protein [Nostoc sp. 'Peltigera membranacea cyanobiont' 232]|uniref:hypothetical protein n=1 Tax=Nostoc sp. 'Peltigera membranacea cyanobiont' 232 TaxID=2014531 RepID=UPI000B955B46|nr:hypothetical protein [Nostoc sp. 'Peltigera membranacea cyanobiont' 232]OYE02714.1 hypothetical protein CDG79_22280 [Nostoc sp. 'Peltigera membranacea cyanobiont' 232]
MEDGIKSIVLYASVFSVVIGATFLISNTKFMKKILNNIDEEDKEKIIMLSGTNASLRNH